jgi:hypothetical protein
LDDSDVGDEAETSPDNEASVKANNNAGDVKTAVLEWHPSAGKSLRGSYGSHQAWVPENGTILRPKGKGKDIMVSDFLLPWSRLMPAVFSKMVNGNGYHCTE